jgi:formylglycine-generating enzyme required for sulfatase activity
MNRSLPSAPKTYIIPCFNFLNTTSIVAVRYLKKISRTISSYLAPFTFILFSLTATVASSNNIAVSSLSLTNRSIVGHYNFVQFTISWDNSWRVGAAPANWDAAWVFVKYRLKNSTTWNHATLSTSGHVAPSGSTIDASADGKGVFIYRNANGSGTFSLTNVQLRWNYASNGLSDYDQVEVKVYAYEMVYIPQGSFSVGSGNSGATEVSPFYTYPTATSVYTIADENAITVGTTNGNLYYASSTNGGDQSGPIPAAYPKGFAAYYCMKYEISQEQYVAFLNSLTRTQQVWRVVTNVTGTSITDRYVMGPAPSITMPYRNSIRCDATLPASPAPIVFYCDYNGDGTGGGAGDGQSIACNYLSTVDVMAVLDWSGLRPMTEFEFEKACRGIATPVANEFAWGTATRASSTYSISNAGASNEGISANYSTTLGNSNHSSTSGTVTGPLRGGLYAANASNTGRVTAGATYYGIMEMSGNLWERVITVGNATGRAFTGLHGDGGLDASGNANASYWPATDCVGAGFRGGDWTNGVTSMRVSDRNAAMYSVLYRDYHVGGRGVRTAP